MAYSFFATYYDRLTEDIDYQRRATYFHQLFERYGESPQLILDLACGTGSLTTALGNLGYEMIGTDGSEEMLTQADAKRGENRDGILFLEQSMEELDLAGKIDGAVCTLDSINHLDGLVALGATFQRLALFMKSGGLFLFDVNTPYKHREVLGDTTYVRELDGLFCCWQNYYNPADETVEIVLDFFEEQPDGSYEREQEVFTERIFSHEELTTQLDNAGFEWLHVFAEDSFDPPREKEERLIYVARRK